MLCLLRSDMLQQAFAISALPGSGDKAAVFSDPDSLSAKNRKTGNAKISYQDLLTTFCNVDIIQNALEAE
jgi:hypothetical protein